MKKVYSMAVLSCILAFSSCTFNEKTRNTDFQFKEEVTESINEENFKKDILSDKDIEYIAEFDKALDKTITKVSDIYDSTFLIKELFLVKNNQKNEYEISMLGTVSNSSGNGVEKIYFSSSINESLFFYDDNNETAQNIMKWNEEYTSGDRRPISDGDSWEEETEYLLHRTRSGLYGCDIYYFEYPKELLQNIQTMYDEKW